MDMDKRHDINNGYGHMTKTLLLKAKVNIQNCKLKTKQNLITYIALWMVISALCKD